MGFSAADPKHVVPNNKKGEKEEQENKHFVRKCMSNLMLGEAEDSTKDPILAAFHNFFPSAPNICHLLPLFDT